MPRSWAMGRGEIWGDLVGASARASKGPGLFDSIESLWSLLSDLLNERKMVKALKA